MGGLNSQFTFYASYHDNLINQIVHIIFVPLIVLGVCVLLSFPPSPNLPGITDTFEISASPIGYFNGEYPVNYAFLYAFVHAVYYAILELPGFAGIVAGTGMITAYLSASNMVKDYTSEFCWNFGWFGIIFGFAIQIFAHQVFEKRSPAFLDNIYQAFVMAPLFVVMEFMFFFGYRSKFRQDVQVDVDANIKAFRAAQKKKA